MLRGMTVMSASSRKDSFFFLQNIRLAITAPMTPPWNDRPPCHIANASKGLDRK